MLLHCSHGVNPSCGGILLLCLHAMTAWDVQDQRSCSSCAAFAATAAAEAAIAAYMNWNWHKISLSEQDLSFCRWEDGPGHTVLCK